MENEYVTTEDNIEAYSYMYRMDMELTEPDETEDNTTEHKVMEECG